MSLSKPQAIRIIKRKPEWVESQLNLLTYTNPRLPGIIITAEKNRLGAAVTLTGLRPIPVKCADFEHALELIADNIESGDLPIERIKTGIPRAATYKYERELIDFLHGEREVTAMAMELISACKVGRNIPEAIAALSNELENLSLIYTGVTKEDVEQLFADQEIDASPGPTPG